MTRPVTCPFCKGCGSIPVEVAGSAAPPHGFMPLKVLAAKAGLWPATVRKHIAEGLVAAQVGEYRVGRRWAVGWLVSNKHANDYLDWLRQRTKYTHLNAERTELLASDTPASVVAERLGIAVKSVLRARLRMRKALLKMEGAK